MKKWDEYDRLSLSGPDHACFILELGQYFEMRPF